MNREKYHRYHCTVDLVSISSACEWRYVTLQEIMCRLRCFQGPPMVLPAPYPAVSHPSPSSFRGSRMRVTDGGIPLTFRWNRSDIFTTRPVRGVETGRCNLPFHSPTLLVYSWCSCHRTSCLWGPCHPLAGTSARRRGGP